MTTNQDKIEEEAIKQTYPLAFKKGYEQARKLTLKEVKEVLDNFKFSNIIRLNSNLGADSVQNMIKEQIMKALNIKTGGEE